MNIIKVERKFLLRILSKLCVVLLVKWKYSARAFAHVKDECKDADKIDPMSSWVGGRFFLQRRPSRSQSYKIILPSKTQKIVLSNWILLF